MRIAAGTIDKVNLDSSVRHRRRAMILSIQSRNNEVAMEREESGHGYEVAMDSWA